MKLHLACGTVYLKGYHNIEIQHPGCFLSTERPDLVEKNSTDIDHYYKNNVTKQQFLSNEFINLEKVCDEYADIRTLPYKDKSIDEILAVQVFEHFTYNEGKELLKHWYSKLKDGGILHLDVPDLDRTIKLYTNGSKNWAIRLLYGSQKNEYSIHKAMYTFIMLRNLLLETGFISVSSVHTIKHNYPTFEVIAIK